MAEPRIRSLSEYRNRDRRRTALIGGSAFVGVVTVGMIVTAGGHLPRLDVEPQAALSSAAEQGGFACTVASITDGDTLRCVERGADGRPIRIRISGIAARERDNSCSPGHPCPSASAEASTAALERLAGGEVLSCRAVGETYGRVAAFCSNSRGVDLSCAMVQGGHAAKWERHWGDHTCRVAAETLRRFSVS